MKNVYRFFQSLKPLEWGLLVAVTFSVAVTLLNTYLLTRPAPPAESGWAMDSTTYYKNLLRQSELNLTLYAGQKDHEARLSKLNHLRSYEHKRIDRMSRSELQYEIDSIYNRSPTHRPAADSTDRGRGTTGVKRSGRPGAVTGGGSLTGYVDSKSESHHRPERSSDQRNQRPAAKRAEQRPTSQTGSKPLPDEVARSKVGKLDVSSRAGRVHSQPVQAHLTYWKLIQAEGYIYPDVAFAISAVETGYWSPKTDLFKNHNLFGFKKNSRRRYVGLTKGGYCIYSSQSESLGDYGSYEWQVIQKYNLRSRSAYLAHIRKRFCPTPGYQYKLDLAFDQLKKIKAI